MSRANPIKHAWQAYTADVAVPRLEDIRASAGKFDRQIRTRNGIEYGACLVVVILFSISAWQEPAPLVRLAHLLIVLGTCFVMWQLHRRASAPEPPSSVSAGALIVHYRAHLARQRDALKGIWWWYLLPFLPGQLLFFAAQPALPGKEWVKGASILFLIAVFVGVWWLNRRGARRLQKAIDELDSLSGEIR